MTKENKNKQLKKNTKVASKRKNKYGRGKGHAELDLDALEFIDGLNMVSGDLEDYGINLDAQTLKELGL